MTWALFVHGDNGWEFKGITTECSKAVEHMNFYQGSAFKAAAPLLPYVPSTKEATHE